MPQPSPQWILFSCQLKKPVWPDDKLKRSHLFPKGTPKMTAVSTLICCVFQKAQKVTIYLGYFCKKILSPLAFKNRPIWSHWANWSWKQVCLPTPTTHARSRITKRLVSEIGKCSRVRFFLFSVRNRNLKENYSENFDAFIDFFVERQNYCQQISSSWSFYRLMSTFCPRLKYALFEILTNVQRNKN